MSAVLMGREKKTKGGEKPVEPASSGSIRIKPDLTYKLRIIVEAEKTSVAVTSWASSARLPPSAAGPVASFPGTPLRRSSPPPP